ncbi:MAG: ATP-binding protein [Oscillospiraceae bacterium]|nr:ATP-binding protein [Oscillospiraceae bacterium]
MLFSERAVRDNIRNRDGKRVFYLSKGDQLTNGARDYLQKERIEILPAALAKPDRYRLLSGGYTEEKPEHMTHLHGDLLVPKTHPRIAFRGAVDLLEAELLWCSAVLPSLRDALGELLTLARRLLRCDVLEEPLPDTPLCGLTPEQLRAHSHRPQDYYGKPHFMPEVTDGEAVLLLNRLRSLTRFTELKAACAFSDENGLPTRPDIVKALNRMSSMLYILMIKTKE